MNQSQRLSSLDVGALFKQVFDMRFAFLAVLDPQGVVLEVNQAPARFGLVREDFVGRHFGRTPQFASDASWVDTWNSRFRDVVDAQAPISYQDFFSVASGEVRSADAILSPVFGDDGDIAYFVVEAEDTTDQVRAELALRASERQFHDLAESIPVVTWACDAAGNCDYLNGRWRDYTGVRGSDHLGWNWIDAVHPDDRPQLADRWTTSLQSGEPFRMDYRLRGAAGQYRWFEMRAEPVRGAEGEVVRWYGSGSDIHEAVELRRELAERDAQLTAALRAGAMARFTYDLESRRFTADPFLRELVDVPRDVDPEAGLDGFLEHVHPDDRAEWQRVMGAAFDPDAPEFTLQYRLTTRSGPPQRVGSRGKISFDAAGKPTRIAGVVFALAGPSSNESGPSLPR